MILRNPIPLAVALFTIVVVAMATLYTVPETKQAVVLRLGKPERIVNAYNAKAPFGTSGAGLVAKVPFIENVIFVDKRVLDLDISMHATLES